MFMRASRPDTIATRASLVGRLKNWDDQTSWGELDRTYRRLIVAFTLKQGLNDQEAQDVAQDTLLAVARDIAKFEYDPARSSFKNWLLTVTRHRITDHIRRRSRAVPTQAQRAADTTRTSTVARLPDPNGQALEAVWDEEGQRHVVDQAMEQLKTKVGTEHFQIFYLSVIKGQASAKVAAALGVNLAKVYVVRHRLAPRFKKLVATLKKELG
jgi:RNA polymerase sigma-70 factor (ECF subfamily)